MPDYQSAFNSALSGLDNSVNVPSYTPIPLSGFHAPTPIPINGGNWNFTPNDFNMSPQSNPQNSAGGSSSLFSNWLDSFKTGWNSVEDNPITRNILQPVGNTFSGISSMFSAMAPGDAQPLSWSDVNPFNTISKGISGFWQGYNNPEQSPLGKEDATWRSLLANSLDPRGKLQSPFQSLQEGWNNPSNQPSYRSIANDMLLGGNDVRGLSGILGLAGGFTNPVNLVGMKAPFSAAEDASTIARDLPGHYVAPETVGSMPKTPMSEQPFNVLSQPPKFDMNFDSVPNNASNSIVNDLPKSNMNDISSIADSILSPSSVNIKQPTAYQQEFNQALQDEFNRLKDIRNNPPGMASKGGLIQDESPWQGGNILGSFKPVSQNPQWYSDFYKQFDRKPTNNELMSIAKDNLLNGEKDNITGDLPSWKPQAAQELEDNINQINEIMKYEKDPQTLESLGNTLNELAQEHDNIMNQAMNEIKGGTSEAAPSIAEQLPKEEPTRTFVMNANAARNIPKETPNVAESMPKPPLSNPNYKPGGLFGWWENKLGNPAMNAAGNVASKIADAPIINKLTDTLGKGFVKNYGASHELTSILNAREAEHTANQSNILDSVRGLGTNHGLSDAELNDIGHVIEQTKSGSDKQNSFISKYQKVKENGISDSTGTNALLNTAIDGKPLLSPDQMVENHFSHMYRNVPDDLRGVFPKSGTRPSGLSHNGEFALPRTYGTLQEAMDAGLKPVTDPLQVLGEYLYQTSKSVTNAKALNDIKNTPGLLFSKDAVDNVSKMVKTGRMTAEQAAQSLGMSLNELKQGFVPSSIPQLNKYYIRPADEAALKAYLTHTDKSTLYDKLMGGWKKGTVFNSLVHMHNILYNGMFLGKAKIGYTFDTLKNLASKQPDEWYQRAMKAGAISADHGSFMESLKSSIKNVNNPVRDKLVYMFHGVLWDMDKAMRTAIFREAVERGATDTQAAARANKFLINYNNLTPFEEKVMTRIFPFYRWMKGNIPLQAEQWITNTPKQALAQVANMQLAQAFTGQPTDQEGKWDLGTLPNGDHIKMDTYFPGEELGKIANKGVLPYLYGTSNPILKEVADQVFNRAYYPNENLAPHGKESMANSTIRNDQAPFEDNAVKTIGHTLSNFLPALNVKGIPIGMGLNLAGDANNNGGSRSLVNGLLGGQQKDAPPTTPGEYLTKALGGFTSRDNPAKDAYYQQKDQKDAIQRHISYERQNGIPVSKAEYKQAYKKIPFPIGQ